jgi:SAM-dependent methyltransferase
MKTPGTSDLASALRRCPYGIAALQIYEFVLADREVSDLLQAVLLKTYRRAFGDAGELFVTEYWRLLESLPRPLALPQVEEKALQMREKSVASGLKRRYWSAFRDSNLQESICRVDQGFFNGSVLDLGCDDNRLGDLLLKMCPQCEKVIGVDIEVRDPVQRPDTLQFRRMPAPTILPLSDKEVSAAVCRYSLHHMRYDEQDCLLAEVRRTLRDQGRFVIFENTFSTALPPTEPDPYGFHSAFLRLSSRERMFLWLAAMDAFSFAIKDKNIPFPHAFRCVEEWIALFQSKGFSVVQSRYYGLPAYDLHQQPFACFVLARR